MRIATVTAPTPPVSELPALVAQAKSLVQDARAKVQLLDPAPLAQAREALVALPPVLECAIALSAENPGVYWALQGTRLLARAAHAKVDALLTLPNLTPAQRLVRHRDVQAQLDLVLERITNAGDLVLKP